MLRYGGIAYEYMEEEKEKEKRTGGGDFWRRSLPKTEADSTVLSRIPSSRNP